MRVLIAEDDGTSRMILASVLKGWGYEVVEATDGDEAWRLMREEDAPRLLILDWMMPGRDGVELCEEARLHFGESNPPYIILLTALGRKEDILAGFAAGADDYVAKPFDRNELKARVKAGVRILTLQETLLEKVASLEEALSHVKTLQGILPICMYCHKIRNDEESWERLDSYIQSHTDTEFSHGLCPDCLKKYYPDVQLPGQPPAR